MYWFTAPDGGVLYVGKAKNLKKRVSSYALASRLAPKTVAMVSEAAHVQYHELSSELEALLVEAELIRMHQPPYNILLKDDKSALYVMVTKEDFPRVITLRKSDLSGEKGWVFGPFPSAFKLRQVLKLVRKIFPWCNESRPAKKPCFYSHLGLCPGVCVGTIGVREYGESMRLLRHFLQGKARLLLKELKESMRHFSQTRKYEAAAGARDRMRMIEEVLAAADQTDVSAKLPHISRGDGSEQLIRFRRLLSKELQLPREFLPNRIECYDVSNTQGTKPVVSMVVFVNGAPAKSEYRLFNIRLGETPNDYAMLQEALERRQRHPEWGRPDLIVIDGGKGQLQAALKVWRWANPVLSLAKEPDRLMMKTSAGGFRIVPLSTLSAADGVLAQRLRDEAHRFAKQHHAKRRTKSVIK